MQSWNRTSSVIVNDIPPEDKIRVGTQSILLQVGLIEEIERGKLNHETSNCGRDLELSNGLRVLDGTQSSKEPQQRGAGMKTYIYTSHKSSYPARLGDIPSSWTFLNYQETS
ncbi:hypothetical protein JTB14_034298 [Gonioctena quinquepunctata]|nr:hypothetical protein JTB14_034298 [Gonioctena quinquepunctata]